MQRFQSVPAGLFNYCDVFIMAGNEYRTGIREEGKEHKALTVLLTALPFCCYVFALPKNNTAQSAERNEVTGR
jgi:hypothetical protein